MTIVEVGPTFAVGIDEEANLRSIYCFVCGLASYNENDIEQHYCGNCHKFHGPATKTREELDIEQRQVAEDWAEIPDHHCRTCGSTARRHPQTAWIWGCLQCGFTTYSVYAYFR